MTDLQGIDVPGLVLEEELGRGAYAIVFRGRRGDRACAVKVARRGGSARWFRRESVALARVRDPGVPAVLEVGETGGAPYLVMELVRGRALSERLCDGPLSEDEVLQLALELARTLRAIHRGGFLHRDLKPHNIVVEREGGRARIVDFGLAVPLERSGEDLAGTRAYAAPEQLNESDAVDARADVYGLGAVLYECATGAPPPPPGPGRWRTRLEQGLREAGCSAGLGAVLTGALARSPAARYPSAAAMLDDLERLAADRQPRGPSAPHRSSEPRLRTLPLVGRSDELERLGRWWSEARGGWGRTVLVESGRGTGKTRLLEELMQRANDSAPLLLHARCDQGDPRPFPTLRELFRGYVRWLETLDADAREVAEARLREATAEHLVPLACTVSPEMADLLGQREVRADAGGPRDAFAEGLAELLARLVRACGPALVVVDDLQWSDPASREVLVRLGLRAPELPLMLLAAARAGERAQPALRRLTVALGTDRLETLALAPLSGRAVGELMHAYIGGGPPDPGLVSYVSGLAGGNPLAALETVEAMLDHGALVPFWGSWRFDRRRADRVRLPQGVLSVLARRLGRLPVASRRVLEQGAIVGREVELDLLGRLVELEPDELRYAAHDAQRAGLVEPAPGRRLRFVHDSVREALVADLSLERLRELHARVARALEDGAGADSERIYEVASHHREAGALVSPRRLYEVNRRAAERALAKLDDESALRFYDVAHEAAEHAQIAPGTGFHRGHGEAALRAGALDESLSAFRRALADAHDVVERAQVLGRIAWVHQVRADPERAWDALADAFSLLGEPMPTESARSFGRVALAVARARARPGALRPRLGPEAQPLARTLCELHYQNARLGIEHGRGARCLQSMFRMRDEAERLGEDPVLARAYALYGGSMTMLGRPRAGRRYLAAARQRAERLADPAAIAYCFQLEFLAACWRGEVDEALALARRCLDDYGVWIEPTDYCLVAHSSALLEYLRGRLSRAAAWLQRAAERGRRQGQAPVAASVLVEPGLRAVEAARAAAPEPAPPDPERPRPREGGHLHLAAWGARVRVHTERGDYGPAFERLLADFEAEGHDPRRAHLSLSEYYVAVAHARVHQCLCAEEAERPERLAQLDAALRDLRGIARIDLMRAHLRVVEGYRAFFAGRADRARAKLLQASALADRETSPWVRYEVARCEAHMLRDEGRVEMARERARIAATHAREHGHVHRLRWVCDELEVPVPVDGTRSSVLSAGTRRASSTTRRRRQLEALLQIMRASTRHLKVDDQGRAMLDELLESLDADRGLLLFESEPGRDVRALTGRTADGEDLDADPICRAVVDSVRSSGEPWAVRAGDGPAHDLPVESRHVIAVPLFLRERVVGVVYVDRDGRRVSFGVEDEEVLMVLAQQVPVVLELTRTLEERDRLEANMRQAQKMEAVGQLAGGVAHDFNNMITVIHASVEALESDGTLAEGQRSHLDQIRQATQGTVSLTRQLLTFARRQSLDPEVYDPNQLLSDVAKMLRPILGDHVAVDLRLASGVAPVKVDRSSFDQAIVNLAVNARDAMPRGGALTIETKDVELDEAGLQRHGSGAPGGYVRIRVTDTGEGMAEDVVASIFEPFFTTKGGEGGSGLGLSMVYGFVKQSHGLIDVSSEPGRGTTFELYLPGSDEPAHDPAVDAPALATANGRETVLVVDDDPLVRRTVRRSLERHGYRVHDAGGGREALELAREHRDEIALVVTDVLMPELNGPDLASRIRDTIPDVAVLYISGYTGGELVNQGVLSPGVELLHKPFDSATLCLRARQLLDR